MQLRRFRLHLANDQLHAGEALQWNSSVEFDLPGPSLRGESGHHPGIGESGERAVEVEGVEGLRLERRPSGNRKVWKFSGDHLIGQEIHPQ